MTLVAIALAAAIVFGFPVLDVVRMGRLKRNSNHRTRMALYRYLLVAEWVAVGLVAVVSWLRFHGDPLLLHPAPDVVPSALKNNALTPGLLTGLGVVFAVALMIPVVLGLTSKTALAKILAAFASLGFLLPQGPTERLTFAAVAVTAGICEEVLYRGFLLHVFHADLHLSAVWAAMAAVVAFGAAHAYQGAKGIAASAYLGAIFMAAYLATGSLLPCVVLHALVDLRPLLLLPREGSPFDDPAITD